MSTRKRNPSQFMLFVGRWCVSDTCSGVRSFLLFLSALACACCALGSVSQYAILAKCDATSSTQQLNDSTSMRSKHVFLVNVSACVRVCVCERVCVSRVCVRHCVFGSCSLLTPPQRGQTQPPRTLARGAHPPDTAPHQTKAAASLATHTARAYWFP